MSEQEAMLFMRRMYFSAFLHGFAAALTGSIIYYFFI